MTADWVQKPLGEVVSLQRGHDLPTQKRVHGDVPIMGSAGITGWHNEVKMKAPGVVVGRSGNSMGEVHYCNTDYWPLNTCLFVTDFKGNDERYIYLLLNSINFDQFNSGSAQKSLNRNAVYPYEVILPESKDEQSKIANLVFDFTSKIELNRQINQTLESMAQAIFKSWFVNFDPIKAKIAALEAGEDAEGVTCAAMRAISGKTDAELDQLQARQPEDYAELKTAAELFPSTMQDSELGEIPLGWEIGCIGDIAKAKGGYAYKSKSFIEVGNPVVKIKNIVGNGTVDLEDCQRINGVDADATGRFLLKDGDLLMAMTGATVGKVGLIVIDGKKVFVNQRVAKFESEKFGDKASWFLFCAFRRDPVFDAVVGAAQGSAQPNISSNGIESTALVLPRDDCINEFSNRVDSLFRKWMNNFSENLRLSEIRDTLLPKLLSRELEINAADKAEI